MREIQKLHNVEGLIAYLHNKEQHVDTATLKVVFDVEELRWMLKILEKTSKHLNLLNTLRSKLSVQVENTYWLLRDMNIAFICDICERQVHEHFGRTEITHSTLVEDSINICDYCAHVNGCHTKEAIHSDMVVVSCATYKKEEIKDVK